MALGFFKKGKKETGEESSKPDTDDVPIDGTLNEDASSEKDNLETTDPLTQAGQTDKAQTSPASLESNLEEVKDRLEEEKESDPPKRGFFSRFKKKKSEKDPPEDSPDPTPNGVQTDRTLSKDAAIDDEVLGSTGPLTQPRETEQADISTVPQKSDTEGKDVEQDEGEEVESKRRGFFRRFKKKKAQELEEDTDSLEETKPSEDDEVINQTLPETPDTGEPEVPPKEKKQGLFKRLRNGLSKTRKALVSSVDALILGKKEIDEDLLEELEEILITSDMGVHTSMAIIEEVREQVERKDLNNPEELKEAIQKKISEFLNVPSSSAEPPLDTKPHVIMVIGVNGVGKTTTIGKLAARYIKQKKQVLLVAADTFRAAAVEQLEIWAERVGTEIVRHKGEADPSAVVFDGMQAALARGVDVVIIDTAGRLHTKVNLMEELKKIRRTASKHIADAPHETLLVLDATTGQNAISQAQLFHEAIGVTGIALTKLDGTAKGGVVVGICHSLEIPLKHIGIGEKVDDLQEFDVQAFMKALF